MIENHKTSVEQLYEWCKIHYSKLENHPDLKVPFRICKDSNEMGYLMAEELIDEIISNNNNNKDTRAIIPCGPSCWYEPFTILVNKRNISLKRLIVFHMDECLDWQAQEIPINHPYNFRGYMIKNFYDPIKKELAVLDENRVWISANKIEEVKEKISEHPIDITYGGWGQDGHIAYNQARRHPFSHITIEELRNSTIRIQENNIDTIIALAQRTFGAAYQFVPPMSITLGIKECLSAKKVRIFSDTGSWKQTALRVGLFSELNCEYPLTLLQEHPDAMITATIETASHPISDNPDWELF